MKYAVLFILQNGLVTGTFIKPYKSSISELTDQGFKPAKGEFDSEEEARKFGNLYLGTDGNLREEHQEPMEPVSHH